MNRQAPKQNNATPVAEKENELNAEQIAKLKEVAEKAIEKAPWPFYLTALHREATPEVILELIALAEQSLSAQDEVPAHETIIESGGNLLCTACGTAARSPAVAVEPHNPTLIAYCATDLDGRYDVGTTPEKAKERAGHGCDTVFPIYDIGDNATPSPSLAVRDVVVDDLAMLVRRLVRSLEKANPGTDLAPQALDYLKRKGLQDSPLRTDKPNADCSGEPANCPDNEGYGCACDPMNKAGSAKP